MKKIIGTVLIVLLFGSCATIRPESNESWENLLNKAPHPITVISISSEKAPIPYVLFKDAKNRLFTIYGYQYYSLKEGDIIY